MALRDEMLDKIRTNIRTHGVHVTLVTAKTTPRFAYTIGLLATKGAELVFAGGAYFSDREVVNVLNHLAREATLRDGQHVELATHGAFALRRIDPSWSSALLLGAIDFHQTASPVALQVTPDAPRSTVDVPDLTRRITRDAQSAWRWLRDPWDLPVPDSSIAITNLAALRGEPVTEAMRWEVGEWELFAGAGPEVARDEVRVVPLGTLIAADPTVREVLRLEVGTGLYRDKTESGWHAWSPRSNDRSR